MEDTQHASCKKAIWLLERLLSIQKFDFKVNSRNNILGIAVNDILEQSKTTAKILDLDQ